MLRRASVVVLALALNPALLRGQDTVLTVNVPSADVYKGPSNVTPVIGHASRGTVLPISRNLGSWVKVAWPEAPDGVGYVHVTMGRIDVPGASSPAARQVEQSSGAAPRTTASTPPGSPAPQTTAGSPQTRGSAAAHVAPRGALVTPASHTFGVGAMTVPTSTFGATARTWSNRRLGIQLGFTRETMTSTVSPDRLTSVQFEPGVMYGLFDHVSDYVWIRPYVGSTISFSHQTLSATAPVTTESASDNSMGFRVFGGTELMFSSAPRFGVSADLGYRHFSTTFAGFDADALSVSIAGHWYFR